MLFNDKTKTQEIKKQDENPAFLFDIFRLSFIYH